ncbi:MAG: hypothetical protein KDN22_27140 [Verrucomicrobiae bacterium]|nr:hypothetical protein [Verrucomicrobiae bacterium]
MINNATTGDDEPALEITVPAGQEAETTLDAGSTLTTSGVGSPALMLDAGDGATLNAYPNESR